MAIYVRETRVAAPLEDVWAFYVDVASLAAVTPAWFGLRVESVRGPDGVPATLAEGVEVTLSMRPLGIGPRQTWTSRVVELSREANRARFRDEMLDGPFPEWVHTHEFVAEGEGTLVRDRVEYVLPGGAVGRAASPLGVVGFAPVFWYRHRRTRQLLET